LVPVTALDVRVLGPFEVRRAGVPIPIGRSRQRDLLALLASRSPHPVSPDLIVEQLWREPTPSARKVVQKHVSELRQLLGRDHVASVAGGYALRDADSDADRFEAAYEQARFEEPRLVANRLRAALASWAGEPYADVDLDALVAIRARLTELSLAAIEQLGEARLALGEHAARPTRCGPFSACGRRWPPNSASSRPVSCAASNSASSRRTRRSTPRPRPPTSGPRPSGG
jgi:DNA-binding SARP family transcriptional activator